MQKVFTNARVYTGNEILEKADIVVENHRIAAITDHAEVGSHAEVINLSGFSIAPAFIDLQVYGGNDKLFNNEPTVETIRATRDAAMKGGTAYFQITLSCSPLETMWKAIDACREYWQEGGEGLLGLHLEGPYFNPEKRGAHPLRHIRIPHPVEVADLIERAEGVVTYMTVAPEQMDEASLNLLLQSNIRISAGHSNATYAQAIAGFDKGIERVTHLFNAMSPLQSRAPGLVGATYDRKPWASIVADGIHSEFVCVKISKELLRDKLFLITDAVTESQTGDYQFHFAGDRYLNESGTLAGSALTMWQAVKNIVMHAGISLHEALRMAATYPAKVAGIDNRLGKIALNYEAHFVVFHEPTLTLHRMY
jgi:N-acetylglucosamine-6-phosphate deacetylase